MKGTSFEDSAGEAAPFYGPSPQVEWKNLRSREHGGVFNGGGRGIRTPGTLSGTTVFKTAGINRSPIPPLRCEAVYDCTSKPALYGGL